MSSVKVRQARAGRRSVCRRPVLAAMSGSLAVWLWPSPWVSAQQEPPPLEDLAPSGRGMPGRAFGVQVLEWAMYAGVAVCIGVMIYGGATWAGFGSASTGRAVHGKTYAIGGLVGAAVIGLAPRAIQMMLEAAQA